MGDSRRVWPTVVAVAVSAALAACSAGSSDGGTATVGARTATPPGAVAPQGSGGPDATSEGVDDAVDGEILRLRVDGTVLTATLADNSSAEALKSLLADGPITVEMSDYGNMEKVGPLGTRLPTNDEQITAEPGDLILYQGDALVIYYAPNSWNFTRLGRIQGVTGQDLKEVLGDGDVDVTLSLE